MRYHTCVVAKRTDLKEVLVLAYVICFERKFQLLERMLVRVQNRDDEHGNGKRNDGDDTLKDHLAQGSVSVNPEFFMKVLDK